VEVEVVLADAALQALLVYRWPGNLRQLRQVLRYACAVSEGGQLRLAGPAAGCAVTRLFRLKAASRARPGSCCWMR
jgi:transcriptional regulator of acetoin/glycerol metabolism